MKETTDMNTMNETNEMNEAGDASFGPPKATRLDPNEANENEWKKFIE